MTDTHTKLDEFTRAYIECALWSETDDNDRPLDENYTTQDIAPETLERMVKDCERFQAECGEWINEEHLKHAAQSSFARRRTDVDSQAGHDFWLTRNGHGAGFWDGDWTDEAGKALTGAAKAYGSYDLYVGDDGKVYAQ